MISFKSTQERLQSQKKLEEKDLEISGIQKDINIRILQLTSALECKSGEVKHELKTNHALKLRINQSEEIEG
jgi:hypothetical protein